MHNYFNSNRASPELVAYIKMAKLAIGRKRIVKCRGWSSFVNSFGTKTWHNGRELGLKRSGRKPQLRWQPAYPFRGSKPPTREGVGAYSFDTRSCWPRDLQPPRAGSSWLRHGSCAVAQILPHSSRHPLAQRGSFTALRDEKMKNEKVACCRRQQHVGLWG